MVEQPGTIAFTIVSNIYKTYTIQGFDIETTKVQAKLVPFKVKLEETIFFLFASQKSNLQKQNEGRHEICKTREGEAQAQRVGDSNF